LAEQAAGTAPRASASLPWPLASRPPYCRAAWLAVTTTIVTANPSRGGAPQWFQAVRARCTRHLYGGTSPLVCGVAQIAAGLGATALRTAGRGPDFLLRLSVRRSAEIRSPGPIKHFDTERVGSRHFGFEAVRVERIPHELSVTEARISSASRTAPASRRGLSFLLPLLFDYRFPRWHQS